MSQGLRTWLDHRKKVQQKYRFDNKTYPSSGRAHTLYQRKSAENDLVQYGTWRTLKTLSEPRAECRVELVEYTTPPKNGCITHKRYVRKYPAKQRTSTWEGIENERLILKMIGEHPHIIHLESIPQSSAVQSFSVLPCVDRSSANVSVVRHYCPWLLIEYIDGCDLYQYAKKYGLGRSDLRRIVRAMCEAFRYCHKRGVIHMDLKPENVLVTKDLSTIKLIDFGLAELEENDEDYVSGTGPYLAPEVRDGDTHTTAIDMWCLGIMMYELAHGDPRVLKEVRGRQRTDADCYNRRLTFDDQAAEFLGPEGRAFVRDLLREKPHKRLTAKEALRHVYLNP